jgi:hypothetical protein
LQEADSIRAQHPPDFTEDLEGLIFGKVFQYIESTDDRPPLAGAPRQVVGYVFLHNIESFGSGDIQHFRAEIDSSDISITQTERQTKNRALAAA